MHNYNDNFIKKIFFSQYLLFISKNKSTQTDLCLYDIRHNKLILFFQQKSMKKYILNLSN
jgi:hypothetical protein